MWVIGWFQGGSISGAVEERIKKLVDAANDGTHADFKKMRAHVEYTLEMAKRPLLIPSSITTSTLTHWRTEGSERPTNNSISSRKVGGQQFWTLSEKFLKENSK